MQKCFCCRKTVPHNCRKIQIIQKTQVFNFHFIRNVHAFSPFTVNIHVTEKIYAQMKIRINIYT